MESFCLYSGNIILCEASGLNEAILVREYGRQDKLSPVAGFGKLKL